MTSLSMAVMRGGEGRGGVGTRESKSKLRNVFLACLSFTTSAWLEFWKISFSSLHLKTQIRLQKDLNSIETASSQRSLS